MQGEAVSWSRRALSHWQKGHEVTLQLQTEPRDSPHCSWTAPFPPLPVLYGSPHCRSSLEDAFAGW